MDCLGKFQKLYKSTNIISKENVGFKIHINPFTTEFLFRISIASYDINFHQVFNLHERVISGKVLLITT